MINRQSLLADLQKFLQRIEADLLERSESTEVPEVPAALQAEYEKAAKAERTAQNYEDWRSDTITQAAAAWVLSCVFVRFLEDNSLIDPPKIAGPGDRLARARDEQELYFRSHPQHTDREYLLSIFGELAKLPGTKDIFGEHNAINDLPNWLSGDAAGELLNFFQKIDASTGDLVHDFTDTNWDTRFLGDLYQDLSEAARKKFALLQTPDFVEEFILDRTLEPAIEEFGLVPQPSSTDQESPTHFKMIDPACGSGHFLLSSFSRILARWTKTAPALSSRVLVQKTLDSIFGVDVNPFAIAIARFRLLLAALKHCKVDRLAESPAFQLNLACGDSLYHGRNRQLQLDGIETDESHYFQSEDAVELCRILRESSYHAVVANPPYITPKDKAANAAYRNLYSVCHGRYSLSVPFFQRIIQLAIRDNSQSGAAGFTGQITANSFMKAEFGKSLTEDLIPTIDLTHVVDTSGTYIPGHNGHKGGTPTVILFARNRRQQAGKTRTVMSIKGEPNVPEIAAEGAVWSSIVALIDQPNVQNEFVSVADFDAARFAQHPWSIGGGGAVELKEMIELNSDRNLLDLSDEIGFFAITGEDDAFISTTANFRRNLIKDAYVRTFCKGDSIRDWVISSNEQALFPYENDLSASKDENVLSFFWSVRTAIASTMYFGKVKSERGLVPHEYAILLKSKLRTPLSIAYAFVATHNHFVLDRGGRVFNQTAPVIKLKEDVDANEQVAIAGVLNSSIALFWTRQVCFPRGGFAGGKWEERQNVNGGTLGAFPMCRELPTTIARNLDQFATELSSLTPANILRGLTFNGTSARQKLADCYRKRRVTLEAMVFLQEELDWHCYRLYGLLIDDACYSETSVSLQLGQRAFEIVLARKLAAGGAQSNWFERHCSTPITELPADWPADYKRLVERRIVLIESDPNIRLIEQPEYKRRWNTESWESQLESALREWLLLRLETHFDFDGRMTDDAEESNKASRKAVALGEIAIYSIAQLADAARRDTQFMEVGELYRDDPAFDVQALVEELVLAESVPNLPILRYKDSGLRKRAEWEKNWDLQRREDAGESVGTIPVPPKYSSADFISTGGARYWSLRGKLDVPKERWISFPHCEGPDGTLVICWAGYDHLQQAQAISAYYVRVQTEFGGSDDLRLIPLLASLIELLPWLKQWHNEPNANFDGLRMGDYFDGFVNEEARNMGKTLQEIKDWVPPKKVAKKAAPKSSTKKTSKRKATEEVSQTEADD